MFSIVENTRNPGESKEKSMKQFHYIKQLDKHTCFPVHFFIMFELKTCAHVLTIHHHHQVPDLDLCHQTTSKNLNPYFVHLLPSYTCPKNSICLFLIVFNSDLWTFPSLNTFTLSFFSVHEILNIRLINHISAASIFLSMSLVIVQHSHP